MQLPTQWVLMRGIQSQHLLGRMETPSLLLTRPPFQLRWNLLMTWSASCNRRIGNQFWNGFQRGQLGPIVSRPIKSSTHIVSSSRRNSTLQATIGNASRESPSGLA